MTHSPRTPALAAVTRFKEATLCRLRRRYGLSEADLADIWSETVLDLYQANDIDTDRLPGLVRVIAQRKAVDLIRRNRSQAAMIERRGQISSMSEPPLVEFECRILAEHIAEIIEQELTPIEGVVMVEFLDGLPESKSLRTLSARVRAVTSHHWADKTIENAKTRGRHKIRRCLQHRGYESSGGTA